MRRHDKSSQGFLSATQRRFGMTTGPPKMKKAFEIRRPQISLPGSRLFLFRCFLLCGLLFHRHGYVPPCGTFSLGLEKLYKLLR